LHVFTVQARSPKKISPAVSTPPLPFHLNFQQNTAILSINTFEINTGQFKDSLVTIFQTIKEKGTKHLVIDLRQNGGGTNNNVSMLYSFIATAPFQHLKSAEMIARSLTYSTFISNSKIISKFSDGSEQTSAYLVNDRYAGTVTKYPVHKNLFNGIVVVLTSGNTISAASEFAAIFHYLQRGKIVGEETGGCYYGATGGNYLNLKLPNSGLEVRIPTIRIFTAVKEDFKHQPKGRGTFPDYQISPTINNMLSKKDEQLDKALEMLNN
jgi:C-terminal processing protease CtpA/Prc